VSARVNAACMDVTQYDKLCSGRRFHTSLAVVRVLGTGCCHHRFDNLWTATICFSFMSVLRRPPLPCHQ
jgi:hypothetical protein